MSVASPLVTAELYIQKGLSCLPLFLGRWLGHRGQTLSPSTLWNYCLSGFVGAFGGIGVLFAVFGHTDLFTAGNAPPIVVSFGASAILCYGAVDAPFSQPRALILGHFISALIGVTTATVFRIDLRDGIAPNLQWLAASLTVSIALVAMHLTGTTHPPAGATALLPVVDPVIWALKWHFLPVVLLGSSLVMASALLVNNVQRQWPTFWVAAIPAATSAATPRERKHGHHSPGTTQSLNQSSPHHEHPLRDLEANR